MRQRGAVTSAWSIIRSFLVLCLAVGSLILRASAAFYQVCMTTYEDKSLVSAVLAAVAALVEILFVNPSARSPCAASSAVEMAGRPRREGAATALHSARAP
jgi:hypothetical protein